MGVVDQDDNCLYNSDDVNIVVDSDVADTHDENFADATMNLAVEGVVGYYLYFPEKGSFHDTASLLVVQKNPMFWSQLCSSRDLFHFVAQAHARKS